MNETQTTTKKGGFIRTPTLAASKAAQVGGGCCGQSSNVVQISEDNAQAGLPVVSSGCCGETVSNDAGSTGCCGEPAEKQGCCG